MVKPHGNFVGFGKLAKLGKLGTEFKFGKTLHNESYWLHGILHCSECSSETTGVH